MKVLFFGSSELSVPFLEAIYNSRHKLVLAVTRPDTRAGRGKKISPNPVKAAAIKLGIDIYELDSFDQDFFLLLQSIKYDIITVVSFGKIFPDRFFDIVQNNTVNVHPSLLPKYRGPSPIITALLNGDDITGVSLVKVSRIVDTGDIYEMKEIPVYREDNHKSLENKIIETGTGMLVDFLDRFEQKKPEARPQPVTGVSYTQMFDKKNTVIDWNKNSQEILNMIRAFAPIPGCETLFNKKTIKIIKAEPVKPGHDFAGQKYQPGEIVKADREGLYVKCGKVPAGQLKNKNDYLSLKILKPQNKNEMDYIDFINGYRARPGDLFERP